MPYTEEDDKAQQKKAKAVECIRNINEAIPAGEKASPEQKKALKKHVRLYKAAAVQTGHLAPKDAPPPLPLSLFK